MWEWTPFLGAKDLLVELMPSGFDADFVPLPPRIAELIAHPEGARWAQDCGWVPGTGHCRNAPCSSECLLRVDRQTEARRLVCARRRRRREQQAFAGRLVQLVAFGHLLSEVLTLA